MIKRFKETNCKTCGVKCKTGRKNLCDLHYAQRIKSRSNEMKVKPIPAMSAKRKIESKEYSKLRKEYLTANPVCGFEGCQAEATDIHHKKSRGINLNNVDTWIGLCRGHHILTHDQNIKL